MDNSVNKSTKSDDIIRESTSTSSMYDEFNLYGSTKLTDSQPDIDSWFEEDNSKPECTQNKPLETSIRFSDTRDSHTVETKEDNPHVEVVYVEDIVGENIEKLETNKLIQYECCISYFIQLLLEGVQNHRIRTSKKHDKELTTDKLRDIVFYLRWISDVCAFLANRIEQPLLEYVSNTRDNETGPYFDPFWRPPIIRSSYNFCSEYTNCKKFYNKNESPTCTEHHYVHSLLKYDVDSIIVFLNFILDNSLKLSENEMNNVHLSVKTICFVTRHMAEEISYIDYITKNNSECYHRNNPIDFLRRRGHTKYSRRRYSDDNSYGRDYVYRPNRDPRYETSVYNPLSNQSDPRVDRSVSTRLPVENIKEAVPARHYNYYNPKRNDTEEVPETGSENTKKKKISKKYNGSNRFMLLSEC